jgi:predicted acylesterase/phospholipase RssA
MNEKIDNKISEILSKYKKNKKTDIINLVLSGGGLKGYATIGALCGLDQNNLLNNVNSKDNHQLHHFV